MKAITNIITDIIHIIWFIFFDLRQILANFLLLGQTLGLIKIKYPEITNKINETTNRKLELFANHEIIIKLEIKLAKTAPKPIETKNMGKAQQKIVVNDVNKERVASNVSLNFKIYLFIFSTL